MLLIHADPAEAPVLLAHVVYVIFYCTQCATRRKQGWTDALSVTLEKLLTRSLRHRHPGPLRQFAQQAARLLWVPR